MNPPEKATKIPEKTMVELQDTLESYGEGTGLTVTSINLNVVDYPKSVQEAVDDTQKARNDRDRYGLEATTYANDIIPRARGEARQLIEASLAYKERKVNEAEGDASRFTQLAAEYEKNPEVTRNRLYIETLEEILPRLKKTIVDGQGNLDLTIVRRSSPAGGVPGNTGNASQSSVRP